MQQELQHFALAGTKNCCTGNSKLQRGFAAERSE
jgi:hypothetical protein